MKHIETLYCHNVIVGWELYRQPSSLQNIWMNQISQDDFNTCICFRDLKFHAPSYTVDPMWQEKMSSSLIQRLDPDLVNSWIWSGSRGRTKTYKNIKKLFFLTITCVFFGQSLNKVHGSSKNSSLKIENMANRSSSWFSLLWTQMSFC